MFLFSCIIKPNGSSSDDNEYIDDTSFSKIPMHHFNGNGWASTESMEGTTTQKQLKILTFNVWFEWTHYGRDRAQEMFSIIKTEDPDVVCLQEVTLQFIRMYVNNDFIKENYIVSDFNGATVGAYGVVILSKIKTFRSSEIHIFPNSRMSRRLLMIQLNINDEIFTVGTVHFESLNNADKRKEQFKFSHEKLSISPNAALVGDFNFDSTKNFSGDLPLENDMLKEIAPEYIDVWPHLHPNDEGITFDTRNNTNLKRQGVEYVEEVARLDRVLFKSAGSSWVVTDIKKIEGCFRASDGEVIHASDHFGLLTTFKWNKEGA